MGDLFIYAYLGGPKLVQHPAGERDGEGWMACGHQADAWVGEGGEHGRRDESGSIETKVAFHF
jgi:hypothetical protein